MNRALAAFIVVLPTLFVSTLHGTAAGAPSPDPTGEAEQDPPAREPTALEQRAKAAGETVGVFRLRSDQIHEWLRESRRARYVRRAACLDDALSQSHAIERQGDDAQTRAVRAASENDVSGVDRELVRIQVLDSMSQGLLGTAQQCGRAPTRAAPPRRGVRPR